ncbi:MAG: hypothetical protein PHG00_01850 [Methylococcales bacterium]|nr:hypothetical protein [Methylococcales bacterium]
MSRFSRRSVDEDSNHSVQNQIACNYPDEFIGLFFSKVYGSAFGACQPGYVKAWTGYVKAWTSCITLQYMDAFRRYKNPLIIVYLFITYIIAALHNELFLLNNNGKKI